MICYTEEDFREVAKDLIDGYVARLELTECEIREVEYEQIVEALKTEIANLNAKLEEKDRLLGIALDEAEHWKKKARRRAWLSGGAAAGLLFILLI